MESLLSLSDGCGHTSSFSGLHFEGAHRVGEEAPAERHSRVSSQEVSDIQISALLIYDAVATGYRELGFDSRKRPW